MKPRFAALFAAVLLAVSGAAQADAQFEHLAVRVEQNATDHDFEIVVEATGGDTGLAGLLVTAPDSRVVIDFKAPDSKLGMRTFRFETPEPKALAGLQAAFPEGSYAFTASTVAGIRLSGTARLSHKLPVSATLVRPRPDEHGVAVSGLRIQWRAPQGLAACLVTIENDGTGVKVVQSALAGNATFFAVPDGVLEPGTRYRIAIGTVGAEGNASFVESAFTTQKSEPRS